MRLSSRRIGVFPRGLDGLFLPSSKERELVWLVERERPEERWARRAGHHAIATYALNDRARLADLSTGEALSHSDLAATCKKAELSALFLHSSRTSEIDHWAAAHGLRLCAVQRRWAHALEHKLLFDRFLERHGLPRPRSVRGRAGRLDPLPFAGGAVIQKPLSMGGEGTFFLRAGEPVTKLLAAGLLQREEPCLAREFVRGTTLGITVLVAHEHVALSALRSQCYHPERTPGAQRVFAGIQWLPASTFSEGLLRSIDRLFLRLGGQLHETGFRGFANVDFMVTPDERVLLIECNPRPSAATPSLLVWPELMSGLSVGELLLDALLERRPKGSKRPHLSAMPRCSFAGATLDVPASLAHDPPRRVVRSIGSGVYRFERGLLSYVSPAPSALGAPGTLFVYSSVKRGERYTSDTTLVSVLSSVRLYLDDGRTHRRGKQLQALLEVT